MSLVVGMLADLRASLCEDELGPDVIDTLRAWERYFEHGGAPPDPVPLDPPPAQVEQSLRSCIRNVERLRQTSSDARLHELRSTVSELVSIVARHADMIRDARNEIHQLLHGLGASDEAAEVPPPESHADIARSIRATMRRIDEEASRSRAELNERLHEQRSAMLGRVRVGNRIVESDKEQEMLFRAVSGAANLFGESVTIVKFRNFASANEAQTAAEALRCTFKRDTDVICRIGSEALAILIDTPRKHVMRLVVAASEQAAMPETCDIVLRAESYQSVSDALASARSASVGDVSPSEEDSSCWSH